MATRVNEYIDPDTGLTLIEYDDGMIRRADNGQIFKPSPLRIIGSETGLNPIDLHRARKEKRQNAVRAVANADPDAAKHAADHGDLAYVAVLTEFAMKKAKSVKDPKQIEAARFVMREAGDSSEDESEGNEGSIAQVRGLVQDVTKLADKALQLRATNSTGNTGT